MRKGIIVTVTACDRARFGGGDQPKPKAPAKSHRLGWRNPSADGRRPWQPALYARTGRAKSGRGGAAGARSCGKASRDCCATRPARRAVNRSIRGSSSGSCHDGERSARRNHALDRWPDGQGSRDQHFFGAADLQALWLHPHRGAPFQAVQDPEFVPKLRAIVGSTSTPRARDRALDRREVADPSARPHSAGVADEEGAAPAP